MLSHKKIGLGTVQFGLDYGVSNSAGQVPVTEAAAILEFARRTGVDLLDTAPAYGSAEVVLGQLLRRGDSFSIVTKTSPLAATTIGDEELARVRSVFDHSLRAMGRQSVAGLLVHQADDLLKPGGDRLFDLLQGWRSNGKVGKIGVSVYDRPQIERLFELYPLDLVQLPLNVFDQRLATDGTLKKLADAGVEIHARSVFLQGLVLMEEDALPQFFAPWHEKFGAFRQAVRAAGTTPLEAALSFVKQLPTVAVALIGVQSVEHFRQCLEAYEADVMLDWERFVIDDAAAVDPRRWPTRQ
jgi:aryl-alcohol dehydrogenase-like predicted oxidoreductase